MNDKQKEYIVTKIEKYKEEEKSEKSSKIFSTIISVVLGVPAIIGSNFIPTINDPTVLGVFITSLVVAGLTSAGNAISTISSISKLTNLRFNIERLEELLKLDELNDNEIKTESNGGKHR